jgi:hypothetical protein
MSGVAPGIRTGHFLNSSLERYLVLRVSNTILEAKENAQQSTGIINLL